MIRKGNCLDNAPVESFFGSLKTELVHRTPFFTRREARTALFEYIEIFYNQRRRHSSISYRTPAQARRDMTIASGCIGEEPPDPDFGVNVSFRHFSIRLKPLKLRKAAINYLPRFPSEPG